MDTSTQPKLDLTSVDVLTVASLDDPLIANLGHDVRSPYAETFWTPVLGPTAILALRRFADLMPEDSDSFKVRVTELAQDLGVGGTGGASGRNAPIRHTLRRLAAFDMAVVRGDTYAVRAHVPPLPAWRLSRLSPGLQRAHERYLDQRVPGTPTSTRHPAREGLRQVQQLDREWADRLATLTNASQTRQAVRGANQPFLAPAVPPPGRRGPELER